MKMSDYFDMGSISQKVSGKYGQLKGAGYVKHSDEQINKAAAHAINCHDELVAILVQLQTEGGLGVARHRQIDRLIAKTRGE